MFKSFQDGYLRRLDMNLYRKLKSSAAKRMFRFLDKRFHFTNRLTFDLRTFACERVGFNRNDDNSQLKRRLSRAIRELEDVGYLKPLASAKRFRKVRRGEWEVAFVKHSEYSIKVSRKRPPSPLETVLIDRGIKEPTAAKLVRTHHPESIRKCVREYDELLKHGDKHYRNPPGLLVDMIKKTHGVSGNVALPKSKATSSVPAMCEEAERSKHDEAVRDYLDRLSPEERESLEAAAMGKAASLQLAGYRRAKTDGNSRLMAAYRNLVVESHVRRRLVSRSD